MSRDISVVISDATGQRWNFTKIRSLISFCKKEEDFWNDIYANVSDPNNVHQYLKVAAFFTNILSTIDTFKNIEDDVQFNQGIQRLQQNHLNALSSRWLWSGQPFVSSWIKSYKFSAQTGNAFIEALMHKRANSNQDFNALKGYLLAYEYELQDESDLTQRRNSEKKSIAKLRNQLSNKSSEIIEEVEEFKGDFTQWSDNTKQSCKRKIKSQKKLFCKSQKERQEAFDSYMEDSKKKIADLEATYHEKLRLEKPAVYWKNKAKSYGISGVRWAMLFGVTLLGGLLGAGYFFNLWLNGQEIGLKLNSMQGVIIFITLITIYTVMIKTISKILFSLYHLQRDAEEREQLTHVYLALTNEDGKIDEASRNIILQALFSRADTGLLSKDSSPTMPGLHELLKHAGGNK